MRNILDYGAIPDGRFLNTDAIQRALDAGPGLVCVPAGIFLTGTIWLRSGVELRLEDGAVLLGSPNLDDYNTEDAFPQNWSSKLEQWNGAHLILGVQISDASISGTGTIDGNGATFFAPPQPFIPESLIWRQGLAMAKDPQRGRPGQMVEFCECQRIRVEGVSLINSSCWTLYFYGCDDIAVNHIVIRNPPYAANTDGIDLDCCSSAVVSDCDIDTGDDAIAIRGSGRHLSCPQKICEKIVLRRCRLASSSSVFRIGVGDSLIRDVDISDIDILRGGVGFDLTANYHQSALQIEGVHISNCTVRDVAHPIIIRATGADTTGKVSDVLIEHLQAEFFSELMISEKTPGTVSGITLRDLKLSKIPNPIMLPPNKHVAGFGIRVEGVSGLILDQVVFQ